MSITWKYQIPLKDESVFSEIEKKWNVAVPDSIKSLVRVANAATPDKYKYVINSTEKVFGAVLSFNRGESDTDTVYTALEGVNNKDLFPFAIDPFGNYICVDHKSDTVVFGDHETSEIVDTYKKLPEFLNDLY